ncbi:CPBP family intramembrane metalloprotease [bacterium]|nr:CPBP family intramembrane metalloprotease [bacterium]
MNNIYTNQIRHCVDCDTVLRNESKFCPSCGRMVPFEEFGTDEIRAFWIGGSYLTLMVVFLAVYAKYALLWSTSTRLGFEIAVHGVDLIYFVVLIKETLRLVNPAKLKLGLLFNMVFIGMGTAILVNFSNSYLGILLGQYSEGILLEYEETTHPVLYAMLFSAVMPAIFEEMAFRGFLFNALQKLVSPFATVLISSAFFALVHFSFLSAYWLLPFGLLLGYLRLRYHTIWYGVLLHFTHNACVLVFELL